MADLAARIQARRRRVRRRRAAAFGVGVIMLAGGGSAALAATGGGTARPVTATAIRGTVTQVVEASGTVDSSSRAQASFATNGTVDSVGVKAGQHVGKGQVLAELDTGSLQSNVDSASAAVATAKQRLEADKTGQTAAAGSAGSGTGTGAATVGATGQATTDSVAETALTGQRSGTKSTGSAGGTGATGGTGAIGTSGGGSGTALGRLLAKIAAGQQRVIAARRAVDAAQPQVDKAQQVVDKDIIENTTLRDAQQDACADSDGSSGTSSVSAQCTTARADYESYADTLATDMAGLDKAVAAQDGNLSKLDAAVTALDALLKTLPAAVSRAGSGTGGSTGHTGTTGGGSSGATGSSSGGTGAGTSKTGATSSGNSAASPQTGSDGSQSGQSSGQPASAGQLAADQASIDAAEAELTLARQNLAAATLTSPITGTVASVGFTAGSASNGQSITILGAGNQIVQINVPLGQIDQVRTGQSASLAVDGQPSALHGTVTRIGLLSSTSGGSTTFPVTVTLADGAPKLYDGVGADVTITTGTVSNAVTVPNSAIATVGTRHTVTVVRAGRSTTTRVTLGLTGTDTSQITTGLKVGDRVQLADPGRALPSSATSGSTSTRRFGGGFPGGFSGGAALSNSGGRR